MNVYERHTLSNGLRVLTAPLGHAQSVACYIMLAAGSRYENAANRGIAHFAEHMFFKGTERRPTARDLAMEVDMIGGEYVPREIAALAEEGRLVLISTMGGAKAEIDLRAVMGRRLSITGSTLRARSSEFKGGIARSLRANVWPLLESGSVKPVVHATFPLERASDAHRLMESSEHIGKIVLTL